MKSPGYVLSVVVLFTSIGQLRADLVVNTGTPILPTPNQNWSFAPFQYFAGEFSIGNAYILNSVEGYLGNRNGTTDGTVDIAIHSDGGNIPGGILRSTTFALGAHRDTGWNGAFNLGWDHSPGTYWVSFKPSANISGVMPGVAPNPMDEYTQAQLPGIYNWQDFGPNTFDFLGLGVRIDATPINAVPEPSSIVLLVIGALGLSIVYRCKKQ